MEKRWSKTEVAYLKRNAKSQSFEELAQRFHCDVETVKNKLEELEIDSKGGGAGGESEAAVSLYDEALRLLYEKKWKQAEKAFDKLISAADGPHLSDRGRQLRNVCRARLARQPEAPDPYLHAVYEKNRGNLDRALEICRKQDGADKSERYAYLMASIQALAGAEEEALDHLATAIDLEPKNRVHAFHDPDFRALHGQETFSSLVGGLSSS